MPDVAPTVPTEIVPELTKLNPSRPTPATEPDTLLVGSVNDTEPFGALAASVATEMAAGVPLLIAWVTLPLAAVSTSVPVEAVIGALIVMFWSAANVRLLELPQLTGAATVIVPL